MNLTMTVMMALVLLLLCSGFSYFSFASNRLRFFRDPRMSDGAEWHDSLEKCNQTNETFVTLFDEEDANFTAQFGNREFWLGLRKGRNITWSNGEPVIFNMSSVNLPEGEQICEAIDNQTWRGFNCSDMKPFMCYKDNNYILKKDNKTWCKALQYCRKHYDDLVSINSKEQNVNVTIKGEDTSFWIGLMHDEWEWEDKGCSSFRNWYDDSRTQSAPVYTKISKTGSPSLHKMGSNSIAQSFCSKGYMRIRVITHTDSTWEEAFDYCRAHHTNMLWIEDEEDQNAVVQWLNNTNVADGPFWIAMRQSRLFGFWIWSDRTVSWSNWKNGTQPEPSILNQCGVINKDYTWSGAECGRRLPFLCEEEIVYMNK